MDSNIVARLLPGNDTRLSRFFDRLKTLLGTDTGIAYALIVVLLFFNVLPIVAVFVSSFFADGYIIFTGSFSLAGWEELATEELSVLWNTALYTVGAALLATALSAALGWAIARTDAPLGRPYYYAILFSFFLPPVVTESVWIRLLAEGGVYPSLLGLDSFPLFTLGGMAVLQGIRLVPLGMLLLLPLYSGINKSLEEVSRISGASLLTTIRKITLPLILPGLAAVFLFALIISLGSFRVPLLVGVPAQIRVLATQIYISTSDTPVRFGLAMAQGTLMVAIAIPLLFGYKRFVGQTEQYSTVSGSGYTRQPTRLGAWRYVVSAVVGAYVVLTAVVPVLMMAYTSLLPYYVPPQTVSLSQFTAMASFTPYVNVLSKPQILSSVTNSVIVALTGATLVTVFPLFISWVVQKRDVGFGTVIDYLAFAPIGLPSVALALGLIFIYGQVIRIGIYGTLAIFVVAYFIRSIPINLRVIDPAVMQINEEFLEASYISGAGFAKTVRSILAPLVMNSVRTAWITSFAFMSTELAIALMLRAPGTNLISATLYQLALSADTLNQAYALGILVTVGILAVIFTIHRLTRVRGMELF
ncbi:MAG: ABC transporter permease [Salinigranum sp.]